MTGKVHIGEQIALRPTPDQLKIIFEACKLCGYPQDGAGVLALLMDRLLMDAEDEDDEEEEDGPPLNSPLAKIVEYYKNNPEQLNRTLAMGKALFSRLKK
jgi:hypothetical protein